MQTYSHLLLTKVLEVRLIKEKNTFSGTAVHSKALLLGSVMPDVPLFILTLGYMANRRWGNSPLLDEPLFGPAYDTLYFTNPWWISLHNLLHAPLLVLLYGLLAILAIRKGASWGQALLWFAVGCGLHSIIDIFTHVNDGPLLFFPFNWTIRFPAPFSYWDPQHGARIFAPIEHGVDALILLWLGAGYWRQRREARRGV